MRFEFDWDPAKAQINRVKHGVSFEEAMAVFLDPLALSRLDEDLTPVEERWITLGAAAIPMSSFPVIVSPYVSSPPAARAVARRGNMKKGWPHEGRL